MHREPTYFEATSRCLSVFTYSCRPKHLVHLIRPFPACREPGRHFVALLGPGCAAPWALSPLQTGPGRPRPGALARTGWLASAPSGPSLSCTAGKDNCANCKSPVLGHHSWSNSVAKVRTYHESSLLSRCRNPCCICQEPGPPSHRTSSGSSFFGKKHVARAFWRSVHQGQSLAWQRAGCVVVCSGPTWQRPAPHAGKLCRVWSAAA